MSSCAKNVQIIFTAAESPFAQLEKLETENSRLVSELAYLDRVNKVVLQLVILILLLLLALWAMQGSG